MYTIFACIHFTKEPHFLPPRKKTPCYWFVVVNRDSFVRELSCAIYEYSAIITTLNLIFKNPYMSYNHRTVQLVQIIDH